MQFLDRIFGPHGRNLEHSLDRTTTRHALLTENLANVNVPGYKRRDVDFGVALEQASGTQDDLGGIGAKLGANPIYEQGAVRVDGNGVDLEHEIVSLGETELRYEMLTEMTSRFFGGLKNVIREGR